MTCSSVTLQQKYPNTLELGRGPCRNGRLHAQNAGRETQKAHPHYLARSSRKARLAIRYRFRGQHIPDRWADATSPSKQAEQ